MSEVIMADTKIKLIIYTYETKTINNSKLYSSILVDIYIYALFDKYIRKTIVRKSTETYDV